MTTTEQELTRIQGAKSALRDAILAKGGTLSEDARIDEYAQAVEGLASPVELRDGDTMQGWGFEQAPYIDVSKMTNATGLYRYARRLKAVNLRLPECTDATHLLHDCSSLKKAQLYLPKCIIAKSIFVGCQQIEDINLDLPLATVVENMLYACQNLKRVSLSIPNATNANNIFAHSISVSDIRIDGLKCSIYLAETVVTAESVQYIVEHAQEAMEGAVLTLPRALESKLPEETIEMALEKGFEVAFR